MKATRLVRASKPDGASKSFLNKFEDLKEELKKRVRGLDSSRMLDPEVYRPTPKYGELNLPQSMGPLNNTTERFNYHKRQDRQIKEFKMYFQVAPELPEGPEPYYQRVYKPLTDVLQRLYPTEYVAPDKSVAEGNTIPASIPPYSEDHDLSNLRTCTWRVHPTFRPDTKQTAKE